VDTRGMNIKQRHHRYGGRNIELYVVRKPNQHGVAPMSKGTVLRAFRRMKQGWLDLFHSPDPWEKLRMEIASFRLSGLPPSK
jgi:hypothetical protein